MVHPDYVVLAADVLEKKNTKAVIRMIAGPRAGEWVEVPISVFEEEEFLDVGDDEIVLARWFAVKEKLI